SWFPCTRREESPQTGGTNKAYEAVSDVTNGLTPLTSYCSRASLTPNSSEYRTACVSFNKVSKPPRAPQAPRMSSRLAIRIDTKNMFTRCFPFSSQLSYSIHPSRSSSTPLFSLPGSSGSGQGCNQN